MDVNENAKNHYRKQVERQLDIIMYIMQHEELSETTQAFMRNIINDTYELMITEEDQLVQFVEESEETVH
ncbi:MULTISPECIES: hypothetical protein [Priestia]|uniref:hypothetical protein n=1 Tax=Priestia TaxID=2800373 RepID=UPI0015F5BBFD|nr:hypothetical protein [Priestia aryabhattai]